MAITAAAFEELRTRAATDPELGDFWRYYFDNFAENQEFLRMGRTCSGRPVEESICMVGAAIFGKPKASVKVKQLRLLEIPEQSIIHGTCFIEGVFSGVLYFPALRLGVLAVCLNRPKVGDIQFARFSPADLEKIPSASDRVN